MNKNLSLIFFIKNYKVFFQKPTKTDAKPSKLLQKIGLLMLYTYISFRNVIHWCFFFSF